MRYHTWLLMAVAIIVCTASREVSAVAVPSDYNVVWTSPGTTELNSMPLGNGDIGINLWIENSRDLVFYLGKTDAWDENGSLLKLGKVRVRLPEGALAASGSFRQEFRLQDGTIQINAGRGDSAYTVMLWADPFNPLVQVDVQGPTAFNLEVSIEPWRTSRRAYPIWSPAPGSTERDVAYGFRGYTSALYVEPDTVVSGQTNSIVWYHRNTVLADHPDMWALNLTQQGLDPTQPDKVGVSPLRNNTFGCKIMGTNLQSVSSTRLLTSQAAARQVVSVYALTAQTDTSQQWIDRLDQQIAQTESVPYEQRKAANDQWWSDFNQRSYIRITSGYKAAAVSQAYALQQAINAFAGRGAAPIKFNGSIFTVAEGNRSEIDYRFRGWNQDFRRWGGCYWWQNTRFPYWAMLAAGQFEEMQPLFDMYLRNLNVAKERVLRYYGGQVQGAYFPETMTHWGTFAVDDYGWNKSNPADGLPTNSSIRYYWGGGLELTAMMLQYYDYTGDRQFAENKLLPLATEIVTFFDTRFARDAAGKLKLDPAQALEAYKSDVVNPLPDVAGLHYVLEKLLQLPTAITTAPQRAQWTRLKAELPDLPTRTVSGKTVYAPARTYSGFNGSGECPELYGVFPYLLCGLGKDNLQMGIDTYNNKTGSTVNGWGQEAIWAAMLGMTDTAKSLVVGDFLTNNTDPGKLFPGFYTDVDWSPSQCQANVASIALQRMLVQAAGEQVLLFPTWPSDWDVEFRLFGPKGMIFMGDYEQGAVKWMDPNCDGLLTAADYQLVMDHLGYDNLLGKGNLASLLLGDVNFDGRVTDADRAALLAAAMELGIDPSQIPEPSAPLLAGMGLLGWAAVRAGKKKLARQPRGRSGD